MTRLSVKLLTSAALISSMGVANIQIASAQDTNARNDDEIVVTARRRAETISSVPVAVTAVNAAQIENKAAVDIQDLA